MQIVRLIIWLIALVGLVAFSIANWDVDLTVTVWPNIVMDTNVPKLVIVVYLLGLLPMWLIHRGMKWRMRRRIKTLEAQNHARAESDAAQVQKKLGEAEGVTSTTPEAVSSISSTTTTSYNPTER